MLATPIVVFICFKRRLLKVSNDFIQNILTEQIIQLRRKTDRKCVLLLKYISIYRASKSYVLEGARDPTF